MFVTNAVARVKTVIRDQELIVSAEDAARDIISLGRADVFVVSSVKTPDGSEVFGNYIFDDGMKFWNGIEIDEYKKNKAP